MSVLASTLDKSCIRWSLHRRAENKNPLESRIAARFGVLPNFFRLTTDDPKITENLWGIAQFAYLDNPLLSLLKERLFVYLSLFCQVRYCIARHFGFLVGLGRRAGEPLCLPQSVDQVLPLLRQNLPFKSDLDQHVALCEGLGMGSFPPKPDSAQERAIFACAAHVFLRTPDASRALHGLSQLAAPWAQASACSWRSSLFKATEAGLRLKAGRTGKITARQFASFFPCLQRMTRLARTRAPWIKWLAKCGRSSRFPWVGPQRVSRYCHEPIAACHPCLAIARSTISPIIWV